MGQQDKIFILPFLAVFILEHKWHVKMDINIIKGDV